MKANDETVSGRAARMRDEIRATLHSELSASSQRIEQLVRGPAQEEAPPSALGGPDQGPSKKEPATADDEAFLVGMWRGSSQINGMACNSESIFQDDGGYSSMSVSGVYAIQIVGYWKMPDKGVVKLEYTDYTPRQWGETPILVQTTETVKFRVVSQNQIETSWGIFNRVGPE